jgi:thiosulfate/3-mercaptopyruvate sulfurtransferase
MAAFPGFQTLQLLLPFLVLVLATPAHNETVPSAVSAAWLLSYIQDPNLVVVDLREPAAYAAGHIPESLSLPWTGSPLWVASGGASGNESLAMPDEEVAFAWLSDKGILEYRRVVLVTDVEALPRQMAIATRAAATLRYAGVLDENVGILDGGFPAWAAAAATTTTPEYEVSTVVGVPRVAGPFLGKIDSSFIVDREYVRASIGTAVIIDARSEMEYAIGHIESAISLPSAGIWRAGGFWRSREELTALFNAAVGSLKVDEGHHELIVYCWTGMLASTWFYTLSKVLEFENVTLYEGSLEDWIKKYEAVPSSFQLVH